jgi:hypothetical protein
MINPSLNSFDTSAASFTQFKSRDSSIRWLTILLSLLLVSLATPASAQSFSLADVQANGYTIISGNVYDLQSQWAGRHPGGSSSITGLRGIDGTSQFNAKHPGMGVSRISTYSVGSFAATSTAPGVAPAPASPSGSNVGNSLPPASSAGSSGTNSVSTYTDGSSFSVTVNRDLTSNIATISMQSTAQG